MAGDGGSTFQFKYSMNKGILNLNNPSNAGNRCRGGWRTTAARIYPEIDLKFEFRKSNLNPEN